MRKPDRSLVGYGRLVAFGRPALAFVLLLLLAGAARAEDGYFDSKGVSIHYIVVGQGEPVLLIHGFTASIQMNWVMNGVVGTLAKHYQVIALDNRGHGKSDKPHDPAKYGAEMAEDLVRLLDHLHIKKAHIIGYSMGAFITSKLLCDHPDRFLSATLGGGGGVRGHESDDVMNRLADSLEQGKGIGPLIEALTPANRPKPTEEQIRGYNALIMRSNDPLALAAVIRGMTGLLYDPEKIKNVKVPMLFVVGSDDPIRKGVDAMKLLMPGMNEVVIEGADHISATSRPEFIQAIQDFLMQHKQS